MDGVNVEFAVCDEGDFAREEDIGDGVIRVVRVKVYACAFCDRETTERDAMVDHFKVSHGIERPGQAVDTDDPLKIANADFLQYQKPQENVPKEASKTKHPVVRLRRLEDLEGKNAFIAAVQAANSSANNNFAGKCDFCEFCHDVPSVVRDHEAKRHPGAKRCRECAFHTTSVHKLVEHSQVSKVFQAYV